MNRPVLSVTIMILALTACDAAPGPTSNDTRNPVVPAGNDDILHFSQESSRPEVNAEKIIRDVVGHAVQVSELRGAGPETEWTFEADEYRQVNILEKHMTNTGLTLIVFMATRNNPGPDEDSVQVSGKLRLGYEWKEGQWILTTVENLTFSYSLGQTT
jgi:hypothetical protein